jgi:transcriptional regulator
MSDGDKDYIEQQIASIVGLEIDVTRIVGKSKLSQNREPGDKDGAITALRRKGESVTADAMERFSKSKG